MKHYIFLTSALILAACGAGSGGGGVGGGAGTHHSTTIDNPPTIHMQGFNGSTTVNSDNQQLTGMSSYTASYDTDEATSRAAMIAYVSEHLDDLDLSRSAIRGATRQSMTPRNRDTDPAFTNADVVITRMKQVLHDMTELSGDELTRYVNTYKKYVMQSLALYGETVSSNSTTEDLIDAFEHTGLNSDNIMAELDAFDADNFEITKERMENVILQNSGQEAYYKFKLDDNGKIVSVSLWENPKSEYGSFFSNDEIKIVDGEVVIGTASASDTFNLSKEGWFSRNNLSTDFTNTNYEYSYDLGSHGITTGVAQYITNLNKISFYSDRNDLSADEIKAKMIDALLARANQVLSTQNTCPGDEPCTTEQIATNETNIKNAFVAIVDAYLTIINAGTYETLENAQRIDSVVTMNGIGKDVTTGKEGDTRVGLKYSDIGFATLTETMKNSDGNTITDPESGLPMQQTMYSTYAGGYDTRRIADSAADTAVNNNLNGTTFTGTALVAVEKTIDNDDKSDILLRDNGATLAYTVAGNVATHTLTMNNLTDVDTSHEHSQWYDVVVTGKHDFGTGDESGLTFAFDGTDKDIDPNYQFLHINTTGTEIGVPLNGDVEALTDNYGIAGTASAQYYGDDATTPTEATSRFSFSERYHDNSTSSELAIYGAFGGLVDQE